VVQTADRDEDGRNPTRRRPDFTGKGRWSGVGSPGVGFLSFRASGGAPAMENSGVVDLRPPLPLLRRVGRPWR
jgi:hypothetical protein